VPLGTTLRELLAIAGGPREGRNIVAMQPGGGSSACLFDEHLDLGYDFDTMAANGTMLGSGAIVYFDDTTDFVEAARALVRFYAHESCGQCTPCREGSHWLEVTLDRLCNGGGLDSDIDMLVAVSHQMTGLNLCPLGDSIEPFLASVVKRFEPQFRSKIRRTQREAVPV
jgi:NADH-quinone oxidoreductase subunit F